MIGTVDPLGATATFRKGSAEIPSSNPHIFIIFAQGTGLSGSTVWSSVIYAVRSGRGRLPLQNRYCPPGSNTEAAETISSTGLACLEVGGGSGTYSGWLTMNMGPEGVAPSVGFAPGSRFSLSPTGKEPPSPRLFWTRNGGRSSSFVSSSGGSRLRPGLGRERQLTIH